MYHSAFRPNRRAPEEVLLDTQREYNRRDWEREQKKQRTALLRDALQIARRHPNPTFNLRFSVVGDAEQQFKAQTQLLKAGVLPQQLEWPEVLSHSRAA
jgi:hypothetical protein